MRLRLLAAAGLLAATACVSPVPVLRPLAPDDPRPRVLLASWARLADARHAMRGRARLAVDGRDGELRLRGSQVMVLERPARLRVEIQGLLGQTVAVLVTDGERFELFRAQDRSYETGPVYPGLLWEQAHLALTPEEATDLLLGAPALDPQLRPGTAWVDEKGGLRLDLVDAEGNTRRRAGFDAQGRLVWLEALDGEQALVWRAEFGDYAPVDGQPFAHALTLDVAAGDTRAEISLRDVELNPELPPDIFRLRQPAAGDGGAGPGA